MLSSLNLEHLESATTVPADSHTTSNHVKESIVTSQEENMFSEIVKLNQYTFVRFLGKGSFGSVYLAHDENTHQEYAIKSLSKRRMQRKYHEQLMKSSMSRRKRIGFNNPSSLLRESNEKKGPPTLIQKEIAILKRLNHKNCVKLFEVLNHVDGDEMYMVFELCPLGSIYNISPIMPCDPLPEETARNYFVQTVLGLEYLHAHQIVHRDIKPENLLLSSDHTVKIVDFGVSEYFSTTFDSSSSMSSSPCPTVACAGSPYYLAPECISSTTQPSQASDVWSLGITLYVMLLGRFPFTGTSLVEVYDAIQHTSLKNRLYSNSCVNDLLHRLLTKCPRARITLPEIRAHPWLASLSLPSTEMNLAQRIGLDDVSEHEVERAIGHVQPIWNVVRFATNLKRAVKRHK